MTDEEWFVKWKKWEKIYLHFVYVRMEWVNCNWFVNTYFENNYPKKVFLIFFCHLNDAHQKHG